ncbi:EscI/YscI/HrpB family type III secretion system inner rod protein [Mixta sp. Marseille-Q2659]|uniref:EscI/YscI/HrpB family type III secretion system inner rod protein n=1 Tax=Mixta sp. Marseille-Q2659 TaxID=2736607 RepID=UPI0023B8AA70|nr:EscI/YscI/HrpB family type III secretion system inner rod protein [Mixta sp. Marseille-Q2659]
MKVNNTSPSLTTSVTLEPDEASPTVNEADAQWFSAAMNAPEGSTSTGSTPNIISSLTDAISRNQQTQQSAFRDLQVASRSTNSLDFSAANAALSDYYVQSLMNAKIISKGVQSLDKLTNLQ